MDTGSTDGTPELAAGCGAEVHHLDWPNDFSAARNHALDLGDSDWNLVIDADEWITAGGEQLREWCQKPVRIGMVCVRSALQGQATTGAERRNWIPRLLPRGVRYEGRIHEQPHSALPQEWTGLHVGHDGYLEDQVIRKRGRNRQLLLRELQDRPGDPYLLFQLGREAELNEEIVSASEHYSEAFQKVPPNAGWRHALVLRHLFCLGRNERFDDALLIAQKEMSISPDSPDFFYIVGKLAFAKASRDSAHALSEWLPLATSAWERCLEIGERPELEGSMHGCGSHLARRHLAAAQAQTAHLLRAEQARISA